MSQRSRVVLVAVVLLLLIAGSAADETQLVLIDGSVLSGTHVRREDGTYVLTLEDGGRVALPEQLVETVRLVGKKKPPEGPGGIGSPATRKRSTPW